MESRILQLSQIVRDSGTQSRAAMDQDTIADYRDSIDDARRQNTSAGAWPFPPVEVFYDGEKYHLADGFHRVAAAIQAGVYQIPANIHQGTRRDAVLASVGANATHGLRRTNEDKRRAVQTLLRDEEWQQWSDREIGRRCHVSHPTVAAIRAEMVATGKITSTEERKYVHANGAETTMQTANIGGGERPEPKDIPLSTLAQLEYFARQGSKSSESIYQELADPTCSGYAMQMEWMKKKTGFSEAIIQQAAAHLAMRPRQMANKGEIGLAVGYFLGNLVAGLNEHEAVHVKRSALLSLIRDQKHSVHWAALDLDARLENKPWAIGDLLAVLDIRMRTLEAISGQAELEEEEAEVETIPAPAPVARMVLYGDNGQTITRDLVPAPPAPALDPEASRYDGFQRQTFVNEHGHTETRWVAVERQEDPVLKLLKQAEDAVGRAIAAYDVQAHFDAFRKTNGIYSSLLEVIRLYEYGTSV